MRLDEVIAWGHFAVLGHRGAPEEETENTLLSFSRAVDSGADGVELDVHLSKDGVGVVCHDPVVSTPAGTEVRVAEVDWADLAGLDVVMGGRPGKLCRLEEALDLLSGFLVDIELKDLPLGSPELAESRIGEVVARAVLRKGEVEKTLLTSFYLPHLQRAEATAPEILRGWLLPPGMDPRDATGLAAVRGVSYLLPHTSALGGAGRIDEVVDRLASEGLGMLCWTVNDVDLARSLKAAGAAGVITDRPGRIAEAVRNAGRPSGDGLPD